MPVPGQQFWEFGLGRVGDVGEDVGEPRLRIGDWLGARTELANSGIEPTVLFIVDPFGNVTGGRQHGFTQFNLLAVDVTLDTDKLLGWPGGQFHIGLSNTAGGDLSTKYVGNNFPIQLSTAGAPASTRLTYLSYTQSLFDQMLSIRLGRVTINSVYGEEFLGSEYFKAFSSVGIDLVPVAPFLNAPGAFGYPFATWGGTNQVRAGRSVLRNGRHLQWRPGVERSRY